MLESVDANIRALSILVAGTVCHDHCSSSCPYRMWFGRLRKKEEIQVKKREKEE
jgi:hypothetical protein